MMRSEELNEAYVTGLLTDLEVEVPRLQAELGQAKERASAVGGELTALVRRLDACKHAQEDSQARGKRIVLEIGEKNLRIASLHQEIAGLKRRSEDLKTEMERVGDGAIQRRLRRDRAKISVQIEDRDTEVSKRRAEVEVLRQELVAAEKTHEDERDRARFILRELDQLQGQLPSPYLYTGLFDHMVARAHCRYYLEPNLEAWQGEVGAAIAQVLELHRELRLGKYRLDKNSDIVGGRAMATAEGLHAAVALGNLPLGLELFRIASDPGLFFHQIFNIFRVWCLGLYLEGRHLELKELLRIHQYAPGLRGGYAQTYLGLLANDAVNLRAGLVAIVRDEWEMWRDASAVRGAGVVNLGALALLRLAHERGMSVSLPAATVPPRLLPTVMRPLPPPRLAATPPVRRGA